MTLLLSLAVWTIDAILSITAPGDAQIRPDGKEFAYVYKGDVYLGQSKVAKGRQPRFSPDGKFLAYVGGDGKVHATDNRTLTDGSCTSYQLRANSVFCLALDPEKPFEPIIADHNFRFNRLYRDGKPITGAGKYIVSFAVSPDGNRIAYGVQKTPLNRDVFHVDLYELDLTSGKETALVVQPGKDADASYSPDGKIIAFHSQAGTWNYFEARRIGLVPSGGGTVRYLEPGQYDTFRHQTAVTWSPDSKSILYTAGVGVKDVLVRQDIANSKVTVLADRVVANSASYTPDLSKIVFMQSSVSRPPEVTQLDSQGNLKRLTNFNSAVSEYSRVDSQVIKWNSYDGLPMEGILWLPFNYKPGTRVPVLTELHGGPTGVTLHSFPIPRTYPTQVLLEKGFAVFSPNFRGSSNFGAAFRLRNALSQGIGDYQDVMSGIDYLVTQGIADPDRLGVMGWSYGGYLTGNVISQTNRFKAASVGAPATDWITYYGQFDGSKEVLWTYFGGTPWDVPENYNRHSYRSRLKNIRTPAILQVGTLDINHNAEIYQALTDSNVPVEYTLYPREPHGFVEPAHQKDLMERNLAWFERWVLR